MVEKFGFKAVKKSNFNKQMRLCKRSNCYIFFLTLNLKKVLKEDVANLFICLSFNDNAYAIVEMHAKNLLTINAKFMFDRV